MSVCSTHLPYKTTGYFSKLVNNYLESDTLLQPFYTYKPDASGITEAITDRQNHPVDRQLLADTLLRQYKQHNSTLYEAVSSNIQLLRKDSTFTITTAHQPNLATGYLYFIYKITHAIKLANDLKVQYPQLDFVPVYYMGSEDNDLDELGKFRYNGKVFRWDGGGQKGAVGRMSAGSLKNLLHELFNIIGPPGDNRDALVELFTNAYLHHDTIGSATHYLVNELFGRYGLVVLDPDDTDFKRSISHIIEDDLLNHTANSIVSKDITELEKNYPSQAYPRDINLFYLGNNLRERIEHHGDTWVVLNTDIHFSKEQLLEELKTHPEKFSPNVILRGLLQETILPDVAFIGGGAEVAYWLQLNNLFRHYNVFFPPVLLRQSVLWINKNASELKSITNISTELLFKHNDELVKEYVIAHSNADWHTTEEASSIEKVLLDLQGKARTIDPTLERAAGASIAKIKKQLAVLEQKMLRAEKRKQATDTARILKLKEHLFPSGSLQERTENYIDYFLEYGDDFIATLIRSIAPLRNEFLILEDKR